MRTVSLALMLLFTVTAAAVTVKGEKTYKPYEPIVLKAQDTISTKAQFLWDVDGDASIVEAGDTLYVWAAPGKYRIRLTAIDFDNKKVERASFTFTVSGDPKPPDPGPGPGPDPKPPTPDPDNPAPIPVKGFRVLIVYESAELSKYSAQQQAILTGKTVRDYLNANCVAGPKEQKEWWILDKDADVSAIAKHWQDAMKRPRKSTPWIIVSDGVKGYEGALPASVADTISLLKKYAPSSKKAS